jgi:hypothetical protein
MVRLSDLGFAATSEAEHFKYVADAVNQINFLKAKSNAPADNAKEIVEISCKMLTQIVSDEEFKSLLFKGFQKSSNLELKELFSNLGRVNDVMDKEQEAFEHIGIDHLSSVQALAAALPIAPKINADKINPETILKDIRRLQEHSCSLAGKIESSEYSDKEKSAVWEGVSGVAFVVANSVAAYYSAGAATYVVGFSYPFGATLIGNAVEHLSGH